MSNQNEKDAVFKKMCEEEMAAISLELDNAFCSYYNMAGYAIRAIPAKDWDRLIRNFREQLDIIKSRYEELLKRVPPEVSEREKKWCEEEVSPDLPYIVMEDRSTYELAATVCKAIENGYVPIGGIAMTKTKSAEEGSVVKFYQAMVKK